MKTLLLATDDKSLQDIEAVLLDRIQEGLGEAVFELGYENNGDSMNLTLDEWNAAYARLEQAAESLNAKCQLLLTHNVGGDAEAASTVANPGKNKSCSGKVLIRRASPKVEETIETRIAVVGNGMEKRSPVTNSTCANSWQSMLAKVPCLVSW